MSFSRAQQNRARGYAGVNKLRRTLRRIEPETTSELKSVIEKGAKSIEETILYFGAEHHLTGDMLQSVKTKLGRDGMTAVIGPGAESITVSKSPFDTTLYVSQKSKFNAWQFFKAYWIEFGTKGSPAQNIPPQPAQPFVQPAWDANKTQLISNVRAAVRNALRIASNG